MKYFESKELVKLGFKEHNYVLHIIGEKSLDKYAHFYRIFMIDTEEHRKWQKII